MTTIIQPKTIINRGDVALVLFPNSNLSSAKTRPALIVQADSLATGLAQIII
jgi:mRNA interferase MazF